MSEWKNTTTLQIEECEELTLFDDTVIRVEKSEFNDKNYRWCIYNPNDFSNMEDAKKSAEEIATKIILQKLETDEAKTKKLLYQVLSDFNIAQLNHFLPMPPFNKYFAIDDSEIQVLIKELKNE